MFPALNIASAASRPAALLVALGLVAAATLTVDLLAPSLPVDAVPEDVAVHPPVAVP